MEQDDTRITPPASVGNNAANGKLPASQPVAKKPMDAKPKKPKRRPKRIPIWAKALLIVGLLFGSLIFGLMVGYSVIGKGPVGDVFSFSTWKHILDLIIG